MIREEEEVVRKREEFGGLISRKDAVELIMQEKQQEKQAGSVQSTSVRLADAKQGESLNAIARIQKIFAPREFKKNERVGKVCNVSVRDETASATMVLWNEGVRLVEEARIKRNDCIALKNFFVKSVSPLEVHWRAGSEITPAEDKESIPKASAETKKISELSEASEGQEFDLNARVTDKTPLSEFTTINGRKGFRLRARIADETGAANIVFWNENAVAAEKLRAGDLIRVEGGLAKKNAFGELEVHAGARGVVMLLQPSLEPAPATLVPSARGLLTKISELEAGKQATIEAIVESILDARESTKCRKCGARENECVCEEKDWRKTFFASVLLRDDSGSVRCVFFDALARELVGADANQLVGKKIVVLVNARPNAFSRELECIARKII